VKKLKTYAKRALPVAKFLYQNKRAEMALAVALFDFVRELVRSTSGH
jgi:hypothetical protein